MWNWLWREPKPIVLSKWRARAAVATEENVRIETDFAWHLVSIVRSYYFPPSSLSVLVLLLGFFLLCELSLVFHPESDCVRILSTALLSLCLSRKLNLANAAAAPSCVDVYMRVCLVYSIAFCQIPTPIAHTHCHYHHPVVCVCLRE